MNPLLHKHFLQNFKTLKFLYDLVCHKRGHVFVVQKVWNQLYDFMHSFLLFKKMVWTLDIISLSPIQNDIYRVSKLFINILLIWKDIILCIQQSITTIIL
jgi:hypothetical protein